MLEFTAYLYVNTKVKLNNNYHISFASSQNYKRKLCPVNRKKQHFHFYKPFLASLVNKLYTKQCDSEIFSSFLHDDYSIDITESIYTDSLLRNRMLNELFHEATPVILHEDDLNSMCYSIENRSPYLDTQLSKLAWSIPPKHLINKGYGKYILREAMKGILNDQVRLDRRKKGFNASINSMIDLQNTEVQAYLLDPKAEIFEIIDRIKMEQLLKTFPIPNHFSKFIFNFINAKMFLEMN